MSQNKLKTSITQFLGSKLLSHCGPCASTVPKNCVIFLHGSGDTGPGIAGAVGLFLRTLPETIVFYPTAPQRPYTMYEGYHSHVWHDRTDISPSVAEDSEGIGDMGRKLAALVAEINEKMDIPNSRIVVGGFSQGGHMALHLGYRDFLSEPVAGVFALSAFLAQGSAVYDAAKMKAGVDGGGKVTAGGLPPLFMAHGTSDALVLHSWGRTAFENMKTIGLDGKFYDFEGEHNVDVDELELLTSWIIGRF